MKLLKTKVATIVEVEGVRYYKWKQNNHTIILKKIKTSLFTTHVRVIEVDKKQFPNGVDIPISAKEMEELLPVSKKEADEIQLREFNQEL